MSYHEEFPEFRMPKGVTIPIGFEDTSWHNDGGPSWTSDKRRLQIMIIEKDFSETGADDFIVTYLDADGCMDDENSWNFSNWKKAEAFIRTMPKAAVTELATNHNFAIWHDRSPRPTKSGRMAFIYELGCYNIKGQKVDTYYIAVTGPDGKQLPILETDPCWIGLYNAGTDMPVISCYAQSFSSAMIVADSLAKGLCNTTDQDII